MHRLRTLLCRPQWSPNSDFLTELNITIILMILWNPQQHTINLIVMILFAGPHLLHLTLFMHLQFSVCRFVVGHLSSIYCTIFKNQQVQSDTYLRWLRQSTAQSKRFPCRHSDNQTVQNALIKGHYSCEPHHTRLTCDMESFLCFV